MKKILKLFIFLSIFAVLTGFAYPAKAGFFDFLTSWIKIPWTKTEKIPQKTPSTLPQKTPVATPKISAPAGTSVLLPEIPDSQIPASFSRKDISLYFKKIKISSISASSWGPNPSQIRLSSALKKGETADITGYKLKSNLKEIIIPKAVNVYEPSGLAPEENIVLSVNNYVNIYSNKSAIGKNLRFNKCTGYLENNNDFNPALPQNCPSIPRSEIAYLSGDCQSYVFSLGACKLPSISVYNSFPGNDQGNACREFLNTISHNSCYKKYRSDSDFLSNEWRIWTDWNILDSKHDRLRLFDKNGLLVDEYIY